MNRTATLIVAALLLLAAPARAQETTLVAHTTQGVVVVKGEEAALLALKKALNPKSPPDETAMTALLKQHSLLAATTFFRTVAEEGQRPPTPTARRLTVAQAEEKGLLPVLRGDQSPHAYFARLRALGFTPLWAATQKPDALGRLLPQDVCLSSTPLTAGNAASITVNGQEIITGEPLHGLMLATLPPGEAQWRFTGYHSFFPEPAAQLGAALRALPPGTVVAWAVKGVANRYLVGGTFNALRALGTALRPDQVGSDQHQFGHVFLGVVGKPELAREALSGDETVRLCQHGAASWAALPQAHPPPPPVVVFAGLKDNDALWFLDTEEQSAEFFSPSPSP